MCLFVLVVHINVVFHIEFAVPVTITDSTYYVREGGSTDVTVRTIGAHDYDFTVFLIIKDGEYQSGMDSITVHTCYYHAVCLAAAMNQLYKPTYSNCITLASSDIHLSCRC